VLGARLLFIVQELPYYLSHPKELFSLQFQGLTSFGGVFAGVAVVAFWAKRTKVPFRKYADLYAPAFLAGHIIGRFGCLFNGCCFGGKCPPNLPWGIHVAGSEFLHHPAQIYDSAMNLAALGILLAYEKRNHALGQAAALFFVLHGLTRFIYEFWRAGTVDQVNRGEASSTYWGMLPITEAQGVALAMVVVGAVLMLVYARKPQAVTVVEQHPA
jgi:phosphatidylglycerol:prolipoprotein diacylglycerol transferase